MTIHELPEDLTQLFHNGEREYRIVEYDKPMDNIQSMAYFMELVGIDDNDVESNEGTQITVKHLDFPGLMVIDAHGLGDFFSHGFRVTEYNYG